MADDKDPDVQAVTVWPAIAFNEPLPTFYSDPATLNEYKDIVSEVLAHFYQDSVPNANFVNGAITLERRIAETTPPFPDLWDVDKSYNKIDLEEADEILPELSMTDVVESLSPKNAQIQYVLIRSSAYFHSLSNIFKSKTPEEIEIFFVWKAIQGYTHWIEHPILEPYKRFQNKLTGSPENATTERWKKCIGETEMWIISRFYVREKLSPDAKDSAAKITDVQNEFSAVFERTTWMTEADRTVAQQKARSTVQKVGYPTQHPNVLDSKSLEEFYSGLNISNTTYAENKARASFFNTEIQWAKLEHPTSHKDFGVGATSNLAYYIPNVNQLGIPAGFLQAPVFFDPTVPAYLSYGALGETAGHEISHGFDPLGSHYDYDGRLWDWWSNTTHEAFNDKAQCFVDQYNNYSVPHTHGKYQIDGALTLNENVADTGGLHAAYAAWKKLEADDPGDLLPRLGCFTKEQIFFVANARFMCEKASGEQQDQQMKVNAHAPSATRIEGSMENSEGFKEVFHCPERKPVCKLW